MLHSCSYNLRAMCMQSIIPSGEHTATRHLMHILAHTLLFQTPVLMVAVAAGSLATHAQLLVQSCVHGTHLKLSSFRCVMFLSDNSPKSSLSPMISNDSRLSFLKPANTFRSLSVLATQPFRISKHVKRDRADSFARTLGFSVGHAGNVKCCRVVSLASCLTWLSESDFAGHNSVLQGGGLVGGS